MRMIAGTFFISHAKVSISVCACAVKLATKHQFSGCNQFNSERITCNSAQEKLTLKQPKNYLKQKNKLTTGLEN